MTHRQNGPKVIHIIGDKNSGKTHLIEVLIRQISDLGYRVGAFKHSSHSHPIDKPKSDSDRMRNAGAEPVVFFSKDGMAVFYHNTNKMEIDQIIDLFFYNCDLVIVESLRSTKNPKVIITDSKESINPKDNIFAVISNRKMKGPYPVIDKRNLGQLVDDIINKLLIK